MNRAFAILVASILVIGGMTGPVWASTHSFELLSEATLNGATLAPGTYKMNLNGEEAEIYCKGKLIVKSKFELQPLAEGVQPNTKKIEQGEIREIRLKKEVVVFVS